MERDKNDTVAATIAAEREHIECAKEDAEEDLEIECVFTDEEVGEIINRIEAAYKREVENLAASLAKDDMFVKACELTDAIVSGCYDIPKEMTYAINRLQDAVYERIGSSNGNVSDYLSDEYIKFRDAKRNERLTSIIGSGSPSIPH